MGYKVKGRKRILIRQWGIKMLGVLDEAFYKRPVHHKQFMKLKTESERRIFTKS